MAQRQRAGVARGGEVEAALRLGPRIAEIEAGAQRQRVDRAAAGGAQRQGG
ncbi:hypothetical protein HMPREF0731_4611, partial [Pseudoroseomonas cervicalis ATCC 49957]